MKKIIETFVEKFFCLGIKERERGVFFDSIMCSVIDDV